MLYIIGLGLNLKGLSIEGCEAVKKCKKIYLENYTVEFPYYIKELEKIISRKVILLSREEVEGERLVKESKKENIALLVYGSPLFATTHISLIDECRKKRIKTKVIYSASVFDCLGETGLELYKFGKISSIPKWQEHFRPYSFLDYIIENKKINAHSLILIDIGLGFSDALEELVKACENKNFSIEKILVCSKIGTEKGKIFYGNIGMLRKLGKKIKTPFCFIIPAKMHFLEEEIVGRWGV